MTFLLLSITITRLHTCKYHLILYQVLASNKSAFHCVVILLNCLHSTPWSCLSLRIQYLLYNYTCHYTVAYLQGNDYNGHNVSVIKCQWLLVDTLSWWDALLLRLLHYHSHVVIYIIDFCSVCIHGNCCSKLNCMCIFSWCNVLIYFF